jgi:hypothetical protein
MFILRSFTKDRVRRVVRKGFAITRNLAPFVLCCSAILAQAPADASAVNKPDLSGFWEPKWTGGSGAFIDVFGKVERASLKPDIGPMSRPRGEHPAYGAKDPVDGTACRTLAYPFFMTSSPPFDILQRDDEIFIISEREGGPRHVYMDGRGHPASVEPTSNGDSIGHWEGDTLVIDTVGFRGFAGTPGGGRRGPNTHLVERFQAVDKGQRLLVTFTWDDPSIYTKPHTYQLNYHKMPQDTYAFEDLCDSGDPKEYQSVLGISVIGATSVYEQAGPASAEPGKTQAPAPAPQR